MIDNIIRLPFGQRKSEANAEPHGATAGVSDLSLFRLGNLKYLIDRLTLNLLNYEKGVLCLSFSLDSADREWLAKHEARLRESLKKICAVATENSRIRWGIRQDIPVYLDFPDKYPGRLRVYFATEEAEQGKGPLKLVLCKQSIILTFLRDK